MLTQDEDAAEDDHHDAPKVDDGQGKGKGKGKEHFVDEDTDLIKGVYEGGLKTWECSLDLVDCLDGMGYGSRSGEAEQGGAARDTVRGKSILEVSKAPLPETRYVRDLSL